MIKNRKTTKRLGRYQRYALLSRHSIYFKNHLFQTNKQTL